MILYQARLRFYLVLYHLFTICLPLIYPLKRRKKLVIYAFYELVKTQYKCSKKLIMQIIFQRNILYVSNKKVFTDSSAELKFFLESWISLEVSPLSYCSKSSHRYHDSYSSYNKNRNLREGCF